MVQKLALLWLYGASIAPSLDRSSPRSLGRSLGQKVDSSLPDNTKNARTDGQAGGRTDGRRCHWPENDVFLNITNVCRLLVCEQLSATVCEHFIDHKTLRNRLRYCMWTFHWSLKSFQHPHCYLLKLQAACLGFLLANSRWANALRSCSCTCRRVVFEACELLSPSFLTQLHD